MSYIHDNVLTAAKTCKMLLMTLGTMFFLGPTLSATDIKGITVDGQSTSAVEVSHFEIPVVTVQITTEGKPRTLELLCDETVSSCRILPSRCSREMTIDGKTISFEVSGTEYFVVRINDGREVFVFADAKSREPKGNSTVYSGSGNLQSAIDAAASSGKTLVIPEGTFTSGQLDIPSGCSIFLSDGAVLKASTSPEDFPDKTFININGAKGVKILGHGTIDGSGYDGLFQNGGRRYHLIYMQDCSDVKIDGPLLKDPCFWNVRVFRSSNVRISHIKTLSNRPRINWNETDGVDFDSSVHCRLTDSFLYCGDDNMVVKGLDTKGAVAYDILFKDNITYSNSAASKIGTETMVKTISKVRFIDIDVIQCMRAMVIDAYDYSLVKDVVFKNFRIDSFATEAKENRRLVDFEITDRSWRECPGKANISNVLVSDIHFTGPPVASQIVGCSEGFEIKKVSLKQMPETRIISNSFAEYSISGKK